MASVAAKLPADCRTHITSVGSFETISTGFALAQLSMADKELRPERLVVFANAAPRQDRRAARENNEGEGLLYGKLKNGVEIVAVNSGFSLSFIRDDLTELWSTDAEVHGSQFRSRDFFPRIVASAVHAKYDFKQHKLEPWQVVPDAPEEVIGYIDSFGNLKTTYRNGGKTLSTLKSGDRIKVNIGGIVRAATVATGSFNVMEGDLAFAPGSSGHEKRFWELFKRGGSAWNEFGRPAVGTKIVIEPPVSPT
jgi:hypothetical protein